jgi:hypothetical protein
VLHRSIVFIALFSCVCFAQVPRTMNYQGKLTNNSGIVLNGIDTEGKSISSGVYFVRLMTNNKIDSKTVIYVK